MVVQGFKPEREFIIDLAVSRFNLQYKKKIDPKDCLVKSIVGNYGCFYGYEIDSIRVDDFLRLRIYFNLGGLDSFLPYRLETDKTMSEGALGDEIFVTIGTVNRFYKDEGIYKFRPMSDEELRDDYVHFMDGEMIHFMDGGAMTYVET